MVSLYNYTENCHRNGTFHCVLKHNNRVSVLLPKEKKKQSENRVNIYLITLFTFKLSNQNLKAQILLLKKTLLLVF